MSFVINPSSVYALVTNSYGEQLTRLRGMLVKYGFVCLKTKSELEYARYKQSKVDTRAISQYASKYESMQAGVDLEAQTIDMFAATLNGQKCVQMSNNDITIKQLDNFVIRGKIDAVVIDQCSNAVVGIVEVKVRTEKFADNIDSATYQLACYSRFDEYQSVDQFYVVERINKTSDLKISSYNRADMDKIWNQIEEFLPTLHKLCEDELNKYKSYPSKFINVLIKLFIQISHKDKNIDDYILPCLRSLPESQHATYFSAVVKDLSARTIIKLEERKTDGLKWFIEVCAHHCGYTASITSFPEGLWPTVSEILSYIME